MRALVDDERLRITHALGYRFRLHSRDLPGRPDLTFPGRRKAIMAHGCFWHRHPDPACRAAALPKTRQEYPIWVIADLGRDWQASMSEVKRTPETPSGSAPLITGMMRRSKRVRHERTRRMSKRLLDEHGGEDPDDAPQPYWTGTSASSAHGEGTTPPDVLIPRCGGTFDHHAARDALWARFSTAAPQRQRQSVATQLRQESVRALAQRYGASPTTVQKWRKRETTADAQMGPKEVRSTVLTPEEEAIIVTFRRHTLLPLDDCLYGLQPNLAWAHAHRVHPSNLDERT